LAVVFASLRGRRSGVIALGSLLIGLAWLIAVLSLKSIKLNFLNFVALPISIGVGADYALNMAGRRERDPQTDVRKIVIKTGGAVILCSLTTMLGYLALMLSINRAVRSFGLVAAVGEVTTLMAAILGLPALWIRSRRRQPEKVPELVAKGD
jgi:predicted RND superfamily exporter protein